MKDIERAIFELRRKGLQRMSHAGQGLDSAESAMLNVLENIEKNKAEPVTPTQAVVISDPAIVERRAKVKELSSKHKTIDAIALEVGCNRSTVIRDREALGITKKRQ
ncbi:MAG: hypothetical protein ABI904_00860 [Chloroflexota bacterium]